MSLRPFQGYPFDLLSKQPVYLYYDAEGDSYSYPLYALDTIMQTHMIQSIHFGVRIGAAVVLAGLLFFISRSYRSILFCFYQLNFFLMIISSALQLGYILGPAASMTLYLTGGDIPHGQLRLSIASGVFQVLLIMSLLATLTMQVYVACSDQVRKIQFSVTAAAILACFPTYLIWIWKLVIISNNNIDPTETSTNWSGEQIHNKWVFYGAWGSFAASASFCSLLLCIKLWLVNRKRAQMGIQKFDPIRVLFTMAIQNSVVSAILAIISASLKSSNFGAQSVTASTIPLTAVLLPMGYIWAQFTVLKTNDFGKYNNSTPPIQEDEPFTPSGPFDEDYEKKEEA